MNWEDIIGQEELKKQLIQAVDSHRLGHSLLFSGEEGYGVFPLVLALCKALLFKKNLKTKVGNSPLHHLDLHLSFPVYAQDKKNLSENFIQQFRQLALESPYFDFKDWTQILDAENKQFSISVEDIRYISEKMHLKSFEGGPKILVIWRADKMNEKAANKFLKFLEEPPKDTFVLLTAPSSTDFLPTILSRTQVYEVPRITDLALEKALKNTQNTNSENSQTLLYQAQGNWNTLQKILNSESHDEEFRTYFTQWVRDAFMVKSQPRRLKNIMDWAALVSSWNKEKQKDFLDYCIEIFRLALLENYALDTLVYKKIDRHFHWKKFSAYIHGANIEPMLTEISLANLHLVRNGNSKIIWTDLGIKLSRYLHKSA
ncbi:MAG: DNA polymerase III subunit delta' [Bergeyella sp.]|nr:DNA polymerase III subunit delta' [Bergeyella sp.]